MKMSRKIESYFELAKRVSWQSEATHRHGAVLVRGGAIINVSCNKSTHCSFAMKFTKRQECATHHAEIGAILGLGRETTSGSSVFVTRTSYAGQTKMSKPCPMCVATLKYVGVKRVYYTLDEENEYEVLKL